MHKILRVSLVIRVTGSLIWAPFPPCCPLHLTNINPVITFRLCLCLCLCLSLPFLHLCGCSLHRLVHPLGTPNWRAPHHLVCADLWSKPIYGRQTSKPITWSNSRVPTASLRSYLYRGRTGEEAQGERGIERKRRRKDEWRMKRRGRRESETTRMNERDSCSQRRDIFGLWVWMEHWLLSIQRSCAYSLRVETSK